MKKAAKPKKSDSLPATKKMLRETERKLGSKITSVELKMKSGFEQMKSEFALMRAQFAKIDSQFSSIRSDIQALASKVHQSLAASEEVNAKSTFALDGYTSVYYSQGAIKARVENLEKAVYGKKQT